MAQNSRIQGLGTFTVQDGSSKTFRPRDYGGGQIQFVVGTTQAIGSTLYGFLGDTEGQKAAAIHPGPPITIETDSSFSLIADGAAVTFVVGIIQGFFSGGVRSGQAAPAQQQSSTQTSGSGWTTIWRGGHPYRVKL